MKSKKIIPLILSLVALFFVGSLPSVAAEFKFSLDGQNINIDEGEMTENLYVAGNAISINSEVKKDLYVAGNVITIEKDIENNFCGAGETVVINGDVGNNAHIMAGTIVVKGDIKEDLFVAGGNILIEKSSRIEGDLVIGGGFVDIRGPVDGNLYVGGGDVNINSKISGTVNVTADSVKIGKFAKIEKNIKYTSPKKADIHEDAEIVGAIDFNQKSAKGADKSHAARVLLGILSTFFLLKIITSIIVGFALVYLFNGAMKMIVTEGLNNIWGNLGTGLAALLLFPVVIIILATTIVGLYLAGLLFILYILLVVLSSIVASITFGSWLIKVLKKREKYSVGWQEVVVGVIILKIVWFIPLVGWILGFVFMLVSAGAIFKLVYLKTTKNINAENL